MLLEEMKWVIRIVVALFFSFVFFGAIQYFFPFNIWLSAALALVGGLFIALREAFDFVKKGYEARKAPYELRELQRKEAAAEGEKTRLIRSPSADELRKHGQSAVERTLDERFKKTGEGPLTLGASFLDPEE
jgi:hypothetical protein